MPAKRRSSAGQGLLLMVFMVVMLVLAVPVIVFMNNAAARHGTSAQQKQRGLLVAEAGIEYAKNIMMRGTNWTDALTAAGTNCLPAFGQPAPTIVEALGGRFRISCSQEPGLPNALRIQSTALGMVNGRLDQPVRTVRTVMSPRTVAVQLPSGLQVPGAVLLGQTPVINGDLRVHWGPIFNFDTNSNTDWVLTGLMESQRYPRKFSQTGITGATPPARSAWNSSPPFSDQKEYWALFSLGSPPAIDYSNPPNPPTNPGSGYRIVPGAVYANAAPPANTPWIPAVGGTYIYDIGAGNTMTLKHAQADLKNANGVDWGALIVTGNLSLQNNTSGGSIAQPLTVRLPPTANEEYPYTPSNMPCSSAYAAHATTCGSPENVDIRGFVYVQGNLTVETNRDWVIDGVLRVDGLLTIENNASLHVYYDDDANRAIKVSPFELQNTPLMDVSIP